MYLEHPGKVGPEKMEERCHVEMCSCGNRMMEKSLEAQRSLWLKINFSKGVVVFPKKLWRAKRSRSAEWDVEETKQNLLADKDLLGVSWTVGHWVLYDRISSMLHWPVVGERKCGRNFQCICEILWKERKSKARSKMKKIKSLWYKAVR